MDDGVILPNNKRFHNIVVPLMGIDDYTHPLSEICGYLSPLSVALKL
jgi:hypothetical protein